MIVIIIIATAIFITIIIFIINNIPLIDWESVFLTRDKQNG